ncbi:MAG TPA: CDP-alcohol phosphatidyltransferase family protein [Planctomycetota bacterium]|nr:CDP-alcohol phosphatidyltransferase family protein [Planctomycetota bacterium]
MIKFRLSWPNRITFLRILLIPVFVLALIQMREGPSTSRWIALGLLIVVSLGDALDGLLARRLHARSKLGAFLDPLADKMLMTAAYLLLASSFWPEPRIPKWVAGVVVSRDVLIALFYFSIMALESGFRPITPSLAGKGCTTLQMLTLVAVIGAPVAEHLFGVPGAGRVLMGLYLLTVFATLVSGIDYLYAARTMLIAPDRVALIQSDVPERRKTEPDAK